MTGPGGAAFRINAHPDRPVLGADGEPIGFLRDWRRLRLEELTTALQLVDRIVATVRKLSKIPADKMKAGYPAVVSKQVDSLLDDAFGLIALPSFQSGKLEQMQRKELLDQWCESVGDASLPLEKGSQDSAAGPAMEGTDTR